MPAGTGASAAARDSTTTSASATVASSSSRPPGCSRRRSRGFPGASHSRRTTGSTVWVQAQTMSAPADRLPRTSADARTGMPSARRELVRHGRRPLGVAPGQAHLLEVAHAHDRPSVRASLHAGAEHGQDRGVLAREQAVRERAEPAAVRAAVMWVPSSRATGRPSPGRRRRSAPGGWESRCPR